MGSRSAARRSRHPGPLEHSSNQGGRLKWFDPEKASAISAPMPERELTVVARNNESFARFCWDPCLHNPKLHAAAASRAGSDAVRVGRARRHRYPDYGKAFSRMIPQAKFAIVTQAGHYPHLEQPTEFLTRRSGLSRISRIVSEGAGMDVWHFTEMPYPHLPPLDTLSTMRVTLPSRHYDPKIGADLYNRYLDDT
jgi:hypothetical protein